MAFSDAMVVELERMWAKGWSCGVLAVEIGKEFPEYKGPLNRNVIIGVVTRQRAKGKNFPERVTMVTDQSGRRKVQQRRDPSRVSAVGKKSKPLGWKGANGAQPRSRYGNMIPGPSADPGYVPPDIHEFDQAFAPDEVQTPPKSLLELEPGECRWPVEVVVEGRTETHFCGSTIHGKGSYCPRHRSR